MSTIVSLNSVSYQIPAVGEDGWGDAVSSYLIALSTGILTKAGGPFTLTSEVDFGPTYGFKVAYIKSLGTNLAQSGMIRLANAEGVTWRNAANTVDLVLTAGATNRLTFNSEALVTASSTDTLTNKTINGFDNTIIAMSPGSVALPSANIIVGNGSNVGAGVSMTGDISIDSTGSTAIGAAKVTNTMLAGSIAYSKLVLTGTIVNADVSASAAIARSKLALTGTLVDADINASAAIAYSKLALASSIVLTSDVTGTLPIGNGGTGQTTAAAALTALLPSQAGENGKILGTNGTVASWQANTGLINPMTTAEDIIVGGSGGSPTRKAVGGNNSVLTVNGSGVLTYATIVNNNVNAAAAIAGTKIAPNFGSQNIVTTGNADADTVTAATNVSGPLFTNGTLTVVGGDPTGAYFTVNQAAANITRSMFFRGSWAGGTAVANRLVLNSAGVTVTTPYFTAIPSSTGTALGIITGTGQAIVISSSRRFKKNIEAVGAEESEKIYGLREVTYQDIYQPDASVPESKQGRHYGFIAEEVVEHLPHLVALDGEQRPTSMYYERLSVLHNMELKKLKAKLDAALERLDALEAKV